jgi:hypothetical protein
MVLGPVHALVAYIRALPGSWYLTSDVADAVGTSAATLRRLARTRDNLAPSHVTTYGRVRVDLYNDTDVERIAAYLRDHKSERGRPRVWTDAERRQRRIAHSAAGYHRRRAAMLASRGRLAEAASEGRRAALLAAHIREQVHERSELAPRDSS